MKWGVWCVILGVVGGGRLYAYGMVKAATRDLTATPGVTPPKPSATAPMATAAPSVAQAKRK